MGYYLTIVDEDLKCKKDVSDEIKILYKEDKIILYWHWENGFVGFDEGYFNWGEDFLQDLLALKSIGVRGHVTAFGEEGDYHKYVITSKTVREYCGRVVFPRNRYQVMKMSAKMKKKKF